MSDIKDEQDETLAAWMFMTLEERQICVIASTAVKLTPQPGTGRLDVVVQEITDPVCSLASDSLRKRKTAR